MPKYKRNWYFVKLPMLFTIIYIVHLNMWALLVNLVPNTGLWSRQHPNDQFAWIPCNKIPCSLKRRARFLSLAQSKLRLCSANRSPGYWSNLPCDWPRTAWAYSEQETENGPRSYNHRAKHKFVMHRNYSWIFNVYTNPRSSIIIEPTVIKTIRSQYHMVIIIIRHHSWWHHHGGTTEEGNCSYPRGRGRIKEAHIRAKYAKFPWMKSRDVWCIDWMRLDLGWVQIMGS